jgi:hypothetical protein
VDDGHDGDGLKDRGQGLGNPPQHAGQGHYWGTVDCQSQSIGGTATGQSQGRWLSNWPITG